VAERVPDARYAARGGSAHRWIAVFFQPLHDASHLDARRIRNQVHHSVFACGVDHGLLTFDDALVLFERRIDFAEQRLGDGRLVLPEAMGGRPKIQAAGLGDRSQTVEDTDGDTILIAVFLRALAHVDAARPLDDGR